MNVLFWVFLNYNITKVTGRKNMGKFRVTRSPWGKKREGKSAVLCSIKKSLCYIIKRFQEYAFSYQEDSFILFFMYLIYKI